MIRTIFKSIFILFLVINVCSNALGQEKTKSEVDAEIKKIAALSPEWWDSVELTYPKTLDMDWPVQQESFKGLRQFDEKRMRAEGKGKGKSKQDSKGGKKSGVAL